MPDLRTGVDVAFLRPFLKQSENVEIPQFFGLWMLRL